MDTNIDKIHKCDRCNKILSCYTSLWRHKKLHLKKNYISDKHSGITCNNSNISNTSNITCNNLNINKISCKKYNCTFCSRIFNNRNNKWKHEKICKNKTNNEIDNIKNSINEIKKTVDDIKNNPAINNQLIDIISNKNKKIEELMINNNQSTIQPIIEKQINTFESLTLNNIVITSRNEDNFINATQLCQAGGKQFNDWFRLNNTKQLINEAVSETGIPVSQLVDIKKGNSGEFIQGTWIHPDLAIQLAQWLSPKFAIQVSKWIRQLFTSGKVEITEKLLTENKLKDQKIKLLEDTYLKKHKREDYPDTNVIYIITTDDHLKNRTYIIGKAKNLKNRLSTYNKTCEHHVIYYKKCINEEILNLVEIMTLNLLKKYQEKANRDRFILPVENDISLFINMIENCINFYDQYK